MKGMHQGLSQQPHSSADPRPFWVKPRFVFASMSCLVAALSVCMALLAVRHHYESVKLLAGAFSSLFATIAGAFLAFWFALLQIDEQTRNLNRAADDRRRAEDAAARQQLAFDMHREFSSENMLRARTEASRLLAKHPGKGFQALYKSLPESETRPLFQVAEFYDRLALAVAYHRIDEVLVPKLFGTYFLWWWFDEFEKKLVGEEPDTPENMRMQQLHDWMKEKIDAAEYSKWKSR